MDKASLILIFVAMSTKDNKQLKDLYEIAYMDIGSSGLHGYSCPSGRAHIYIYAPAGYEVLSFNMVPFNQFWSDFQNKSSC